MDKFGFRGGEMRSHARARRMALIVIVLTCAQMAPRITFGQGAAELVTCNVEPMTIEEIETRVEAGLAMPERIDASTLRDVGPASPEVVAELERSLAEAEACAYDQRRGLRWASNQLLAEIWPSLEEDFEEYRPEDPETFESPYIGVTYVRELSDGRIGAVYMYDSPAPSPIEPVFYLYVREEGRLVIDEFPSTEYFETEVSGPTPISGP